MRKDGMITSWTLNGEIYIKTSPGGSPVRIYEEDDLQDI